MTGVPRYFACSYSSSYSIVTDVSQIITMFEAMVVALPEPWSSNGSGHFRNTDTSGNTFAITLSRSDAQNLQCEFRDSLWNLLGTRQVRIESAVPYSECYMYVGKYYFHIDIVNISGATPTFEYLRGGVIDTYPNAPTDVGVRAYFYGSRSVLGVLDTAPYCDSFFVTGSTSSDVSVGTENQYCTLVSFDERPMAMPAQIWVLDGGTARYRGTMYQHYMIPYIFPALGDAAQLKEFTMPIAPGILGKFRVITQYRNTDNTYKHAIRIG